MKWKYPKSKNRTIKEEMTIAISEYFKCDIHKIFIKSNKGPKTKMDICSWEGIVPTTETKYKFSIMSWDTMTDCLKYGFECDDDGVIFACKVGYHG